MEEAEVGKKGRKNIKKPKQPRNRSKKG